MSVTALRETLERARALIDQRYTPGESKGISEITEFFAKDWSRGLEQFADHYHDSGAASALGLRTLRVPPSFIQLVARGPSYDVIGIPEELVTLHGESEYEFFADLEVGDTLAAEARIIDVTEKRSDRLGVMGVVVTLNEYRNQHGTVVATHRWTSLMYSAAEAIGRL